MFLNPRWKAIYFEQTHSYVSHPEKNYEPPQILNSLQSAMTSYQILFL